MKLFIDKELFQWEKNRYVFLEVAESDPSPTCIQFYNKKTFLGPEVKIVDNKAKIPDYLLADYLPIMALACTGLPGETQVITRREFKIIKRAKPENYKEDSDDEFYDIVYDGGMES